MVDVEAVGAAVRGAIGGAASRLRPDVLAALRTALDRETSERGRRVLELLLANAETARRDAVPLCQDTGTVRVWLELGAEERLGGDLQAVVDSAVAEAYREHALRMSVARDALFDRANTGDNTPAFIDVTFRPGTGATVHVMLKGGGSDNVSSVAMLPPSAGLEGVERFVLDTVLAKGAAACPPLVVGVGVGSTFDKVASLAKKALLRPLDAAGLAEAEAVERRLEKAIDATGTGPGGLGGEVTVLGVNLLTAPCHIAALPVAVDLACCAVRSASVELA